MESQAEQPQPDPSEASTPTVVCRAADAFQAELICSRLAAGGLGGPAVAAPLPAADRDRVDHEHRHRVAVPLPLVGVYLERAFRTQGPMTRRHKMAVVGCLVAVLAAGCGGSSARHPGPGQSADSDRDGLADRWEMKHFGSLKYTASDCPAGDGVPNHLKYHAGLDPKVKWAPPTGAPRFSVNVPGGAKVWYDSRSTSRTALSQRTPPATSRPTGTQPAVGPG